MYARPSAQQYRPSPRDGEQTIIVDKVVISSNDPNRQALERRSEERKKRRDEHMTEIDKLKEEGNELFRQGKIGRATKKYEEITDDYGFVAAVTNNLAACYLQFDAFKKAEVTATETLAVDPKNIKGRFRRALARKDMNDFDGAATDLRTVVAHDPTNDAAHSCLLEVERQRDEAESAYLRDLFQDPNPLGLDWPSYHEDPPPMFSGLELDSDSEDARHVGPEIHCRAGSTTMAAA